MSSDVLIGPSMSRNLVLSNLMPRSSLLVELSGECGTPLKSRLSHGRTFRYTTRRSLGRSYEFIDADSPVDRFDEAADCTPENEGIVADLDELRDVLAAYIAVHRFRQSLYRRRLFTRYADLVEHWETVPRCFVAIWTRFTSATALTSGRMLRHAPLTLLRESGAHYR